jgi:hypothetical protein
LAVLYSGVGRSLCTGSDFDLIPELHLRLGDGSARQFQDASQFQTDRSYPEWPKTPPQLDNLEVPVQANNIDSEGHSNSMDAGRGFDPQPPSGVQTTFSEKPEHPLEGRVGQLDATSNCSTPGCIRYSEHNYSDSRQLGRLLLPAVHNDSQYCHGQNTSYNLNANHNSSFPLNSAIQGFSIVV